MKASSIREIIQWISERGTAANRGALCARDADDASNADMVETTAGVVHGIHRAVSSRKNSAGWQVSRYSEAKTAFDDAIDRVRSDQELRKVAATKLHAAQAVTERQLAYARVYATGKWPRGVR